MIAATHLAAGAASGLAVQGVISDDLNIFGKVFAAFLAGVVLHLVLDFIPHREYAVEGIRLWITLLAETSAVLLCVLSPAKGLLFNLVVFAGMAGGAAPDLIELAHQYFVSSPWLVRLGQTVHFFHFRSSPSFLLGFYTQVLIAVAAVVFVRHKSV